MDQLVYQWIISFGIVFCVLARISSRNHATNTIVANIGHGKCVTNSSFQVAGQKVRKRFYILLKDSIYGISVQHNVLMKIFSLLRNCCLVY